MNAVICSVLTRKKASATEPYPACAGIPTVQSRMPLTLHPVMKEAYILSLSGLYRAGIGLSRGILFLRRSCAFRSFRLIFKHRGSLNIMMKYDNLWETMRKKGVTQYALIQKHHVSPSQITRLKRNEIVSTHTIEMFCRILDCNEMGQVPLKGTCLDHVIVCVSGGLRQPDILPAGDAVRMQPGQKNISSMHFTPGRYLCWYLYSI